MTRHVTLVSGAVLLLVVAVVMPRAGARAAQATIQLDVVALDDRGAPVDGLTRDQFRVREDGRPVPITSFTEVSVAGAGGHDGRRTVIVVLDDTGVPATLTSRVQRIARMFVDRTGVADRLSVVRFNNRTDEAVGGRGLALERIADYHAGAIPFFGRETIENALRMMTKLSRRFDEEEPGRRTIVCIGAPGIFDVKEPRQLEGSILWPFWVDALTAASRANLSLYVLDPRGLQGRVWVTGNGLTDRTGGATFSNTNDFAGAVDRIWREAGHYYLIGYSPPPSSRRLHDVDVKVARPGVRVRVRRTRG